MLFYGGGINYSGDLEISCESASDITRNLHSRDIKSLNLSPYKHACVMFAALSLCRKIIIASVETLFIAKARPCLFSANCNFIKSGCCI